MNQFTNQLGYYQSIIDDPTEIAISEANQWVELSIPSTMINNYNTDINRNNPTVQVRGVWKIDMSFTVQGSLNADLKFRCRTETDNMYELKWNARGGNNWSINYTQIVVLEKNANVFMDVNNTSTTTNMTFVTGIMPLVKLY